MIAKTFVLSLVFMSCIFANSIPQIDIVNVVWGKDYTDAFLKISLPLQLCPGNFGSIPPGSARYRLFTTRADWEAMQSDPAMKELQTIIPVEFIEIEMAHGGPWGKMNECHAMAIRDAGQQDRALIFLSPDCLLANNTFQTILQNAREGKRCIMVMGIRTKKEMMLPLIWTVLKDEEINQNGLAPRRLVSLSLPHIHPMSSSLFFDKIINKDSSAIYWKLDDENLISYGFHLHPIFVWPETSATSVCTIDDDFIPSACPTVEKWKIIQDSDEMIIFEFSDESRSYRWGAIEWMGCNPLNIAAWAKHRARQHHWHFVDKPMYIHASDYKQEWNEIKNQANEFIRMVKLFGNRY